MKRHRLIVVASCSLLLAAAGLGITSSGALAGKEDLDTGEQCWGSDCFETDKDIPDVSGGTSGGTSGDDTTGTSSDGGSPLGGIRGLAPGTAYHDDGIIVRASLDDVTSGHVGEDTVTLEIGTGVSLPNGPQYYGITAIGIREVGNRPCHVQIFGGLLDTTIEQKDRLLGEVRLARCETESSVDVSLNEQGIPKLDIGGPLLSFDYQAASLIERENRFARSVRVCTSNNGLGGIIRLKGVRILPAEIIPIAKVAERKVYAGFERANCSYWDDAEICETGEIVTALKMHTIDDWFTGIQPICRTVESMAVPDGGFKQDQTGF